MAYIPNNKIENIIDNIGESIPHGHVKRIEFYYENRSA
jgi:hypothetical protein